ncbi:MAG: hypothetical protein DRP83_00135 [Planctomycetota bacterium]|nr:MAG: hypothetical protein DRP83_00135 [Planctomycetota bacterium]
MYRELEKIAFIPNPGKDAIYERLLQREKELAQVRGVKDFTPGMRMSGRAPGPHPAMEKEILKGTGPGVGQKVKHHTIGRLRRLWTQPGKYKWLRQGGLLGGAVGLGLLGKAWIDSAKNEKLLKEQQAQDVLRKYSAKFDYAPNAPVTPKPAKFPKMPAPMSTNAGKPDIPGTKKQKVEQDFSGESAEIKVATTNDVLAKLAFMDEGAMPWIAGLAGGAGGYYAGKKIIDPILGLGQENLRRKIHIAEKIIEGLEKGKKVAPFAGATVGAILLAAIAAKKAKQKQRETMEQVEAMGGPAREGFSPYDRRALSDPLAAYYG